MIGGGRDGACVAGRTSHHPRIQLEQRNRYMLSHHFQMLERCEREVR